VPAQPAWFQQLPSIAAQLRESEIAFFDRQAIQKLFGVESRRAHQLLGQFAGTEGLKQVGNALALSREQLLASVEALARGEEVTQFREQRKRAAEELAEAQAIQRARRVRIPVEPEPSAGPLAALPSTISLRPGRLEVSFGGPEDLWAQLAQLARAAARDPHGFDARVDPPGEKQP